MKRFYYDDALAAAFMAKHFGMKFANSIGQELRPSIEDNGKPFYGHHFNTGKLSTIESDIAYIHADSLYLLEPMVGDLGSLKDFVYGAVCVLDLDRYRGRLMWLWGDDQYEELTDGKIILRNNMPFHSPKEEV